MVFPIFDCVYNYVVRNISRTIEGINKSWDYLTNYLGKRIHLTLQKI